MVRYIFILLIAFLTGCTETKVVIVQGISQTEANELLISLANEKIPAIKTVDKEGNYSISVDKSNEMNGLRVLVAQGAPQQKFASMGTIFQKEGLISSPLEEHARYTWALDQDLEKTISLIDGVLAVRVHVALPQSSDNLWAIDKPHPSTSVFIKYKLGYRIDLLTNRIKLLVSRAIPGLTPDMVEILPLQQKD